MISWWNSTFVMYSFSLSVICVNPSCKNKNISNSYVFCEYFFQMIIENYLNSVFNLDNGNFIIRCDLQERVLNPAQLPFYEQFVSTYLTKCSCRNFISLVSYTIVSLLFHRQYIQNLQAWKPFLPQAKLQECGDLYTVLS